MSAMTPGRFGHRRRAARGRPPPTSPASSSALALARGLVLPGGEGRAVARGERARGPCRGARSVSSIACSERVAVGEVDVAPQRRVGAGDARRVAEARAGGRQPLAPERAGGLGDEDVGDDVRQVRDGGHHPVVDVGVDRRGPRAEAGDEAVQALEQRARRRRRRRQVPGGAVEQVRARVLDAGRLRARQRVAADEARVAVAATTRALGRADVGDDAVRPAPARGPRRPSRAGRRPGRRRTRRRRRRARRRGRRGRSSIAPRASGLGGVRVDPADRRAEARRAASPTDPPISADADDRDDQAAADGFQERVLPATAAAASTCARSRRSPRCAAAAARRRWPPRGRGAPRR